MILWYIFYPWSIFFFNCILHRTVAELNEASMQQTNLGILRKKKKVWKMEFNRNKCYVFGTTR